MKFMICISILLFLARCSSGEKKASSRMKYKGKGEVIIFKNNLTLAKENALKMAFKDVIQQAVGLYISSNSKVEDGESIYSSIVANSSGYITEHEIVKEYTESNFYKVEIIANAAEDKIDGAFSKRIEKLISNNSVGPCFFYLDISKERSTSQMNLTCPFNDISIEPSGTEIKFAKSGWLKPSIQTIGLAKSAIFNWENDELKKRVQDIEGILKNPETEIKYKDPATSKFITKKLEINQISRYSIQYEDVSISSSSFIKINNENKKEISSILDHFNKAMKSEKEIFSVNKIRIQINKEYDPFQYYIFFYVSINDNDINLDSISFKLPSSGLIKNLKTLPQNIPGVFVADIDDKFMLISIADNKENRYIYLSDIEQLITNPKFEIRYKTKTGKDILTYVLIKEFDVFIDAKDIQYTNPQILIKSKTELNKVISLIKKTKE